MPCNTLFCAFIKLEISTSIYKQIEFCLSLTFSSTNSEGTAIELYDLDSGRRIRGGLCVCCEGMILQSKWSRKCGKVTMTDGAFGMPQNNQSR
jgi:hypothetical protein